MEPNTPKPQDIVDTTDSLEAVSTCRSMKNFLFFAILISLLLTQIIFWLDRLDLIGNSESAPKKNVLAMIKSVRTNDAVQPVLNVVVPLAAEVNVAEEVEKVTEQADQTKDVPDKKTPEEEIILEKDTEPASAEESADQAPAESAKDKEPFRIPGDFVRTVVAICNFFIIAGAVLYSLTLLISLKISLAGRLGGMSHITKAFFISLLLVIFVIPWQQLLPGVLVGAVWLPGELFNGEWGSLQNETLLKILFYLRFCGLWLIAMWFLFWAQSRSGKWARATLRRLGVTR